MFIADKITFKKLSFNEKSTLFSWLDEPHVKEFWDNSKEHRDDIVNFMEGRKKPAPYFNGIVSYWVGFYDKEAYCLVLTHEESPKTNTPNYFLPYLAEQGKTFGLDFCIGNKNFLGKGLAAETLQSFINYFSSQIEPNTKTFIIDPLLNNPRAIHVYQKAGFTPMDKFIQQGGYFDQESGLVMVCKLETM